MGRSVSAWVFARLVLPTGIVDQNLYILVLLTNLCKSGPLAERQGLRGAVGQHAYAARQRAHSGTTANAAATTNQEQ